MVAAALPDSPSPACSELGLYPDTPDPRGPRGECRACAPGPRQPLPHYKPGEKTCSRDAVPKAPELLATGQTALSSTGTPPESLVCSEAALGSHLSLSKGSQVTTPPGHPQVPPYERRGNRTLPFFYLMVQCLLKKLSVMYLS